MSGLWLWFRWKGCCAAARGDEDFACGGAGYCGGGGGCGEAPGVGPDCVFYGGVCGCSDHDAADYRPGVGSGGRSCAERCDASV